MIHIEYVIKTFAEDDIGRRELVEIFLNEKRIQGSRLITFSVITEPLGYSYHLVFEHESVK